MRCLVTVGFVQGQQEAIGARMPAEQAHVRQLVAEEVIKAIYIAADRSRVWLELQGESTEQLRRTMTTFPLYPFMELELTPLLEPSSSRGEV
jgi:muconolactone delta-isomerase